MIRKHLLLFILLLIHTAAHPAIKAVVFDFGGVVATTEQRLIVEFLMGSFPISVKETNWLLAKWTLHLRHEGDEREFWENYATSLDLELPPDWLAQFHHTQACALHPIPETLDAIMKLQQQGYSTAMLSNVTVQHAAIIRKLGYYNLFHPTLLSYEIGVRKPHARAYRLLLEQLSLPPSEILFIDDQNANVRAARRLGIHGIHFTRPEKLERALQNHGVLP